MALEFFISHFHVDKDLAEAFAQFLTLGVGVEPKEVRCTSYQPTGLAPGSLIEQRLRQEIKRCRCFVPLITPNTPGGEFVAFEIGAAWAFSKSILPLTHGDAGTPKLPALISGLLHFDLAHLDTLVKLGSELTSDIFVSADQRSPSEILAAARTFIAATGG